MIRLFLLGTLALTGHVLPAAAESYCVACYGPDAVYRCVIADAPATAAPDPRNQIQCIKQLATTGSHARCSVERFSTAGCNGPERVITPTADAIPLTPPATAAEPSGQLDQAAPAQPEPEDPAASDGPPRTVEELAKSTVESTKKSLDGVSGTVKSTTKQAGEQIEGVGSSIGQAAKKSWNCLTSLFNDC